MAAKGRKTRRMSALALLLVMLSPQEDLADKIVRCGIDRAHVKVRHEELLQDDTAIISTPDAALTSDHLACLVGLAMGGGLFALADPAAQARFDPLIKASDRAAADSMAREWLSARGLLEKLPVYDPGRQTLAQYAVSLEALCGLGPGQGLGVTAGNAFLFVAPGLLGLDEARLETFQCLVSAAIAADLEPKGVTFGFIGNEQPASE